MTQVLDRPRARPAQRRPRLATTGALIAASTTALGAAGTLIIGVLSWAGDPRSGATAAQAARLSLAGWLLAQHVALAVPGGTLSVPPLAITALLLFLTVRGGRLLARSGDVAAPGMAARAVVAVALPYGLLALGVAALAKSQFLSPDGWQAACYPGALAAAGTYLGLYREAGRDVLPRWRLASWIRPPVRAGLSAAVVVLCGGAALFVVVLATHAARVAAVASGLHPGTTGGVLLAALNAVLAPNAAVAGAAYAVGPGFAIGTGSQVGPLATHLGALPALPLLAAAPSRSGTAALAVFALPAIAGVVAALRLPGSWRREPTVETVAAALGAGAVAGLALGLAAAIAGGAGGPGSLTRVGASPWPVGLAAAAEIALAAALSASAGALPRLRWAPRQRLTALARLIRGHLR